jgi:hypothetical protein
MRAFLELLGDRQSLAHVEKLAPKLARGELDALRAEGFLQPTGSPGIEEVSLPDVIRAVRAHWGAGSGGARTRSIMSHAPMHLGWFEIDDEPCELVLVADDAHALAAAAGRRERALVLVPTDRAMTPELRRRHDSRARVRFVVLAECLGVHGGRVCRVDLPVPVPPPLPARSHASAEQAGAGPLFDGATAWEQFVFFKEDELTFVARFERRRRRLTAQDIGLAGTVSRKPHKPFKMFMAFLESDGCLKTRRFGGVEATKTTLSRLRAALKTRFGVDDDPFAFKPGMGWIARFRVSSRAQEAERALSRGARAMLERAGKLNRR